MGRDRWAGRSPPAAPPRRRAQRSHPTFSGVRFMGGSDDKRSVTHWDHEPARPRNADSLVCCIADCQSASPAAHRPHRDQPLTSHPARSPSQVGNLRHGRLAACATPRPRNAGFPTGELADSKVGVTGRLMGRFLDSLHTYRLLRRPAERARHVSGTPWITRGPKTDGSLGRAEGKPRASIRLRPDGSSAQN